MSKLAICSAMTQADYDKFFDGMVECLPPKSTIYLLINGKSEKPFFNEAGESDYKGHKVKRYEMGWESLHFSNIKNALLEQVREDWVLYLNADDRLCYNPNHLDVSKYPEKVGAVKCMVNMVHEQRHISVPTYKLFRSDLRYSGAVHESVIEDLAKKGYHISVDCLSIHHIGYEDNGVNAEKAFRNLDIMVREGVKLDDRRTQWHVMSSLQILDKAGYFDGVDR